MIYKEKNCVNHYHQENIKNLIIDYFESLFK